MWNNLDYYVEQKPHKYFENRDFITACRKGKLGKLFDLKTLKEDYKRSGIDIDCDEVGHKKLSDFLKSWDVDKNPGWLAGLILGYPVENTISLYLEGCI